MGHPYTHPEYNVTRVLGPFFATFVGGTLSAADKTFVMSANHGDRLQFFRDVRLTGMQAILRFAPDAKSKPTTDHAITFRIGTGVEDDSVIASGPVGTADNGLITGSVAVSAIDKEVTIEPSVKVTKDGTLTTIAAFSMSWYLEYQNRM